MPTIQVQSNTISKTLLDEWSHKVTSCENLMSGCTLEEYSQIEAFVLSVKIQAIIHTRCIAESDRLIVFTVNNTIIIPIFEFQVARH